MAWGWEGHKYLGVADRVKAKAMDFGEWVEPVDGEVPVFWECGVTGEIALRAAKIPGVSMTHYSGCKFRCCCYCCSRCCCCGLYRRTMFVTDLTAEEVENVAQDCKVTCSRRLSRQMRGTTASLGPHRQQGLPLNQEFLVNMPRLTI